jgi:polyisoprenoid-binding protein YceI
VLVAAAAVVVLAVGVPFAYIHFIEGPAPAPLGLNGTASPSAANSGSGQGADTPLAGTWAVGAGSRAGYRVNEVLAGQNNVAVGRTSSVGGHLVIRNTTVTAGAFTVKMATIHSDQSQRDAQFDGRIMDVATYPTGTFTPHPQHQPGAGPGHRQDHGPPRDREPHDARPHPAGHVQPERAADRDPDPGLGLDPHHVRGLGHTQPQLRWLRHHAGPRRARVPARAEPGLTVA